MTTISLKTGDQFYIKDPSSTRLGASIVSEGVVMLNQLGYEGFTFKKLADRIHSTEASIYRYFENKHQFLLYLVNYFWQHVEYLINYHTHHIEDPVLRLGRILYIITHVHEYRQEPKPDIDLLGVKNIVVNELEKTYLTKNVDSINKVGVFKAYKHLCHEIALVISEICPDYPYSHALTSTMVEASLRQLYFSLHLPSLTEIDRNEALEPQLYKYLLDLVERVLGINMNESNGRIRK